ncbi:MAG: TIGR02679 domain-containing protein [Anaerovoracaceae bacterium]|jgi:uncharacterized protein (TIGR02679 family)
MIAYEKLNEEMAYYLKGNKGAWRLMDGMREKYRSFGRFSGTLEMVLTGEEADFLNGLMKKHYSQGERIRLSIVKLLGAFEETRFKGFDFLQVCNQYFGYPLETKKDEWREISREMQVFFSELQKQYYGSCVGDWISSLGEETALGGGRFIKSLYRRNPQELKLAVGWLREIESLLEKGLRTSLPILAAEATKNPHALDKDQSLYRILLYFLAHAKGVDFPQELEGVLALFDSAGISVDVGNRTILTYGFNGRTAYGDKGWDRFWKNGEPLTLTMRNLEDVIGIYPVNSQNQMFAFENPALFTRMTELEPVGTFVCTSGQLNMLDHRFLKLLFSNPEHRLYYSGDYDPEGLLIADKLWAEYPNQIVLFGYQKDLYRRSISGNVISEKRLQQLANIENPQLVELAGEMKAIGRAGYQEYVADILKAEYRSIQISLYSKQ